MTVIYISPYYSLLEEQPIQGVASFRFNDRYGGSQTDLKNISAVFVDCSIARSFTSNLYSQLNYGDVDSSDAVSPPVIVSTVKDISTNVLKSLDFTQEISSVPSLDVILPLSIMTMAAGDSFLRYNESVDSSLSLPLVLVPNLVLGEAKESIRFIVEDDVESTPLSVEFLNQGYYNVKYQDVCDRHLRYVKSLISFRDTTESEIGTSSNYGVTINTDNEGYTGGLFSGSQRISIPPQGFGSYYTVEFKGKGLNGGNVYNTWYDAGAVHFYGFSILASTSSLTVNYWTGSSTTYSVSVSFPARSEEIHYSLSVAGSVMYLGVDGVVTPFNNGTIPSTSSSINGNIGVQYNNYQGSYSGWLTGYLKDFRITTDVARYTETIGYSIPNTLQINYSACEPINGENNLDGVYDVNVVGKTNSDPINIIYNVQAFDLVNAYDYVFTSYTDESNNHVFYSNFIERSGLNSIIETTQGNELSSFKKDLLVSSTIDTSNVIYSPLPQFLSSTSDGSTPEVGTLFTTV